MSLIDKLRFSVACTDGWDDVVIINNDEETIPHDEPAWYLNAQRKRR